MSNAQGPLETKREINKQAGRQRERETDRDKERDEQTGRQRNFLSDEYELTPKLN